MKVKARGGRSNGDQRAKFVEGARDLGCDESEERFDAALKKIGTRQKSKDTKPKKAT